jgi:uncharacterized protein (UPF0276 family)
MTGIGYRHELADWIETNPRRVDCLEITAEHFFHGGEARLEWLRDRLPLFVHGLGQSLGTPGPLDKDQMQRFAGVAQRADAKWISEHIAFTRTAEADLGHLNPILPTRKNADLIASHARELAGRCERPIILENITSHLLLEGELSEPDFLNAICQEGDCGLLLDVTNLFINSRNHRFDPLQWLDALDIERVTQLHIVGYAEVNGRFMDDHANAVQPELLELAREVIARCFVKAVILERDEAITDSSHLDPEIAKLRTLFEPD